MIIEGTDTTVVNHKESATSASLSLSEGVHAKTPDDTAEINCDTDTTEINCDIGT